METSDIRWTDTHCHLYAAEFADDRDLMIRRAFEAGVTTLMLPNIDQESIPGMLDLVQRFPANCFPMMGLHPCSVKADYRQILTAMEKLLEDDLYVGIGETGIDLYWDTTFRKEQEEAFEIQLRWGRELGLPVIIHSRESLELNIDIVSRMQDGRLKGIFHCFSGTQTQVRQIADLGFKVGIGGVLTFKKSGLPELLPHVPTDMLVLETDAPYLAPVPYRGKRNESAYIPLIANVMVEVLGFTLEEVSRITLANAASVFARKV